MAEVSSLAPCPLLHTTLLVLLGYSLFANAELTGPCSGCHLFNYRHHRHPENKPDTKFCHYPCQCPIELLNCVPGNRTVTKDGCGCCYMCARLLGEACSVKEVCDSSRHLYCDRKDDTSMGICKSEHKKNPCFVSGARYEDGETFAPDCTRVCTCQDGFYGCSTRCPQELVKPSELTCKDPRLVPVEGQCCKEWTCQKIRQPESAALRGLESKSLVRRNPPWYKTTTVAPHPRNSAGMTCQQQRNTDWTPCSVTCGTGVSVRTIVDQITCATARELKLCLLRPCGENFNRTKCTPTAKSEERRRIEYQDCESLRGYRLKFCDTCKTDKCCYPKRTREKTISFKCSTKKIERFKFMWIQQCRCSKKCYQKGKRRGRKRQREKRRRLQRERRERRRNQRMIDRKARRRSRNRN